MGTLDPAVAISTGTVWLLTLVASALVLTGSGLVALSIGATLTLLALGGVLLVAVFAFVRYYSSEDRRLF